MKKNQFIYLYPKSDMVKFFWMFCLSCGSGYGKKNSDARWATDPEQYDWALVAGAGDWDYSWNVGAKEIVTTTSAVMTTPGTVSEVKSPQTTTANSTTAVVNVEIDWDSWSQECEPDCDRTTESSTSTSTGPSTAPSTASPPPPADEDILESKMVTFIVVVVVICFVVLGIGTYVVIRLCRSQGHEVLNETGNETQMTVITEPIIQVPPIVQTGHLVSILVPEESDTTDQPELPVPSIPTAIRPQLPVPIQPPFPILPHVPVPPPVSVTVPGGEYVRPDQPGEGGDLTPAQTGGQYFRSRLTPVKFERQKSDQGKDDLQGRLSRARAKYRANKSGPAEVSVPVSNPTGKKIYGI